VKQIPLLSRDGSVRAYALVDDEDYEELSSYRWHLRVRGPNAYAQRSIPRVTTVLMHRQIMGFPDSLVDHIDGDGLNNVRSNVRLASTQLNGWNKRGASKNSSTGLRGVRPRRGSFQASVQFDGVRYDLGSFATAEKAGAVAADFRRAIGNSGS
jgi:hypothetical protein